MSRHCVDCADFPCGRFAPDSYKCFKPVPKSDGARELALELAYGMWEPTPANAEARNAWLGKAAERIAAYVQAELAKAAEEIAEYRELQHCAELFPKWNFFELLSEARERRAAIMGEGGQG